jgi:YidC/Oxa1 family membrane protein insertase
MQLCACLAISFAPPLLRHPASGRSVIRSAQPALLEHATTQWIADAAILLDSAESTASAASAAIPAAEAAQDPGWFDTIVVKPFESGISGLHDFLKSVGIDQAYGPAIILFTLGVKAITFPLTKTQIESTTKMQAIQPAAKALQDKYKDRDPARLNQELQKLYSENQVNPLAGCLPAFAQIPLFIGLYRSLLNLAKENRLTEPFLWLPSLEGPVSDYTQGISWLKDGWVNGAPPLGWHDTLSYLVLPVLLVISQYASTTLLTPKSDDPAQQQSQAILKFLPLMIGWFSLNVPSGLGLYWITNNVVTTATTLLIRRSVGTPELVTAGTGGAMAAELPKPQGFGRRYGEIVEATTTRTDSGATITIKPPGASKLTRAERRAAAVDVDEVVNVAATPVELADADALSDDSAVEAPKAKKLKRKKKKTKGKKD